MTRRPDSLEVCAREMALAVGVDPDSRTDEEAMAKRLEAFRAEQFTADARALEELCVPELLGTLQ